MKQRVDLITCHKAEHFIQKVWFPFHSCYFHCFLGKRNCIYDLNNQSIEIQVFLSIFRSECVSRNQEGKEEASKKFGNLLQRWQWCLKNNCLLMVKTKQKNDVWPLFFSLSEIHGLALGFIDQKWMTIHFAPFKPY